MNPLTQNPVEFADDTGIRVAEKLIAAAYRKWRVNPVIMRHAPRAALIIATTAMALIGPAGSLHTLLLAASFALVAIAHISEDLPAIRSGWNADTFRSYSAKALKSRETTLFRRVVLCAAMLCITVGTSIVWSVALKIAVPFACFLVMELSIIFTEWMVAADLPEPDDGDFVAAPHSA
jgi:hypothetical protein